MISYDKFSFEYAGDYFCKLDKNGVILYQDERRKIILDQMVKIQENSNLTIEIDEELLDEIVAITEYPTALLGAFDKDFLQLPSEVIIASMKEHQRYFPVFKNGELTNRFVVVSNGVTDDYSKIIVGNERVLKPRLSDALFFYKNDLKRGLVTDGLENIVFMDGLGTLADKINREKAISLRLLSLYMDRVEQESGKSSSELTMLMEEAISLAKADLTSEMVYEFTELQGLMGYYYAKALGKDDLISMAIKEQYFPLGEGAELPSSIFSSIVSMAIKIDTIIGLFSIGKIPTGSKDPFALRRAVNGIIRMVIEYDLAFDIDNIIELVDELYGKYNKEKLVDFILDRINKSLDANSSVISAVLSSGEKDINEIAKKVEALNKIVSQSSFKEQFSTFKRVANISKEVNLEQELTINPELFIEDIEQDLYSEYLSVREGDYNNYDDKLNTLFGLKPKLDRYFDSVMVNVDDDNIKENRKNTVASIYKSFKEIADIKEISI